MSKFKVGDRVRPNDLARGEWSILEEHGVDIGTIIHLKPRSAAIRFDKKFGGHNCNGKCEDGYGWFLNYEEIDLVEEEPVKPAKPYKSWVILDEMLIKDNYDNACWYCRKGGLVDLYLDGAMGICPNCKRVCNDIRRSCPVDIERKPSKRKNEPLTIEELKALPVGTKVYIVWRWDMRSDTKREPKWDESGWGVKATEERCNWKSPESDTNWQSIDSYDRCFDAWLTEPERPEPELPF